MTQDTTVLIICPFTAPNQGGVESHIQKLVKFIGKKGPKTIVSSYQPLTTPVRAPIYEKKENYEIYRIPWFGRGLFSRIENNPILTFLYLVPGLLVSSLYVGIKRRSEIGVIHAHGFAASFVAMILNLAIRKRSVLSTHAIYNLRDRNLLASILKFIMDRFDFILAVGEPSRQELIDIGIPAHKVRVHPNWVDTDFFSPNRVPNEISPTHRIIFNGRGLEKKGLFLFGELAKHNPTIHFVARVAQDLDRQRFIDRYSNVANLEIRTELPIDFDQKMEIIRDEYRASHIFLMPSLYAEGFSASLLEAASCGLAIISSNLGSLPSILEGSGAVLVDPTVECFNERIHEICSSPIKLSRMQSSIRQFAVQKFSEKNAEVIYQSYNLGVRGR